MPPDRTAAPSISLRPEPAAVATHAAAATIAHWQDLRFGMFIHFGLYSLPAGVWDGRRIEFGYSEQIFHHAHIPKPDYEALAAQFNPTAFDPDRIARLARDAGMRYIVVTAKHHDGFSLFHTRHSAFNVVAATPYGRDVVALLAAACARHGLEFGVYFSWIDWHCPQALPMSLHNSDPIPPRHMEFNLAQVEELMRNYGPIAEVWFDMGAPTLAQSREMAALVRRLQPGAMINGRIWNDQGDFAVLGDNQVPDYAIAGPWQTPASIYHSTWGYRSWQVRDDLDGKITGLTEAMRRVFDLGGNFLLNIGPQGDGSVVDFEADVLRGIGRWLRDTPAPGPRAAVGGPPVCELTPDRLHLDRETGKDLHHFTGQDYDSCKPVVIQRRWRFRVPADGTYAISVVGAEPDQGEMSVETTGRTLTVAAARDSGALLAGPVPLRAGKIHELVLNRRRGPDFAACPRGLGDAGILLQK